MDVRRCTVAELEAAPNLGELIAEYERESSVSEIGPANPQIETYYALEATGAFRPIGAFDGSRLNGLILPITIVNPHYGVLTTTVESFFAAAAARKSGVGMGLLSASVEHARAMGSKVLLVCAPVGGTLDRVLAASKGYRHSNNVYVRALA